jgi:hypothetical protein
LLVLEQNLYLALVDQELHDVITRQVLAHKLHALHAKLKRLVQEKLSLTLPVGLVAFHLASEVLKSRMNFDFSSLTLLLFWILSLSF